MEKKTSFNVTDENNITQPRHCRGGSGRFKGDGGIGISHNTRYIKYTIHSRKRKYQQFLLSSYSWDFPLPSETRDKNGVQAPRLPKPGGESGQFWCGEILRGWQLYEKFAGRRRT